MYGLITVTMKKEEKTKGIIVNRITAGRTAKKMMLFCKIKESTAYTMKRKCNAYIAARAPLMFLIFDSQESSQKAQCCQVAVLRPTESEGSRTGARIPCQGFRNRISGCPIHLLVIPWTILCGELLSHMLTRHLSVFLPH